jgi:hypothetical protein
LVNVQPSGHKTQLEAWLNHADAVLSRKPYLTSSNRFLCLASPTLGKPRSFVYQIPLNKDGIPILPQIDTSEATASQLAQLLDEYLLSLWSMYHIGTISFLSGLNLLSSTEFAGWATNENSPAIPWDEVVEHPDRYFDTLLYELPCPLNAPEVLKSTPHHIFFLHEFFLISSTSLPFQFRSQKEITKELSPFVGDGLDDSEGEAPLNNTSFLMSPTTTTLSKSTTHPIPPSPAHGSGAIFSSPSNGSPMGSETLQSTANTEPASSLTPNPFITNPPGPPGSESIIANSEPKSTVMRPSNSTLTSANPPASMKGTGTKGKGRTTKRSAPARASRKAGGLSKDTKAVEDSQTQPSNAIDSPQVKPRVSTRKSGRAAELKRKQADREVVEQSEPIKKKKRLQDRWFYVPVIPVVTGNLSVNPVSQP